MPVFNQKKLMASATTGHTAVTAGPTDVCKTPAAPSPMPMPYPNVSPTAPPGSGYDTKVLLTGGPAFTTRSKTALSQGDQPGALGGVKSGVVMGGAVATSGSNDVFIGGAPAVRTGDATENNNRNGATGAMVQGAGTVVGADPAGSLCKAFAVAVVAWCKAGKGNRNGTFNDYVFDALQKEDPGLWAQLVREKPIGVLFPDGMASSFKALSRVGGEHGEAADKILEFWKQGAFDPLAKLIGVSWSLFRWRFAIRLHAIFRTGNALVKRILFPDAEMPDGTPIEIKRPREHDSFPGQRQAYAQASPRGICISVDCASCGHACAGWKRECA